MNFPAKPIDGCPYNHTNANSARKSKLLDSPGPNSSWYVAGFILTGGAADDGFSFLRQACVKFNGATDTFTVTHTTSLQPLTADSAFEFMIKAESSAVSISSFMSQWDAGGGWKFDLSSGGKITATVSDGTHTASVTSINAINDGNWHHVILNIEAGESDGLQLFIDGQSAHATVGDLSSVGSIGDTSANFIITGGGSKTYYMGCFGFYRQGILSSSDIEARYACGAGSKFAGNETNLLLGWNFDDGTGSTVKDSKIQSSGTLANTTWITNDGVPVDPHTLPNTITYKCSHVHQVSAVGVMNVPTTVVNFPIALKIGRNCPLWINETDGSWEMQLFYFKDIYNT